MIGNCLYSVKLPLHAGRRQSVCSPETRAESLPRVCSPDKIPPPLKRSYFVLHTRANRISTHAYIGRSQGHKPLCLGPKFGPKFDTGHRMKHAWLDKQGKKAHQKQVAHKHMRCVSSPLKSIQTVLLGKNTVSNNSTHTGLRSRPACDIMHRPDLQHPTQSASPLPSRE